MITQREDHLTGVKVGKLASPRAKEVAAKKREPATEVAAGGAASSGGNGVGGKDQKVRKLLRARLGEDVYTSWFNALDFDSFDGKTVRVSVPVKFLCSWIRSHYLDQLLECCKAEFAGVEVVDVVLRQHQAVKPRIEPADLTANQSQGEASARTATAVPSYAMPIGSPVTTALPPHAYGRTEVAGFEGSPLDPRYTFESFIVGPSNRIAHAAATRVAEALLSDNPGFNPLFMHAAVGLGKTHLLHAIAWEVKRRRPDAKVLYLTAEGFRYRFVEALRSQDPLAFKEKFRKVDILLIDDLEFMSGEKTEQEFDHVINALLDGGRQLVVASARPPAHIERLNERMRSRLQRGLVTELGALDEELRLKVLERRFAEKKAFDPTFELPQEVLALLAAKLTENGRELEGAITRLAANWQYMRTPITMDIAETVIRDLVQGIEPRRIKIEDILRIISRHFGVSKGDLLSQRRHRSVVWPRQIGMYLAKQLTARSLPEIGRRFGNRDHTTVLHAIRKIEGELTDNQRLREDIEELKKLLHH